MMPSRFYLVLVLLGVLLLDCPCRALAQAPSTRFTDVVGFYPLPPTCDNDTVDDGSCAPNDCKSFGQLCCQGFCFAPRSPTPAPDDCPFFDDGTCVGVDDCQSRQQYCCRGTCHTPRGQAAMSAALSKCLDDCNAMTPPDDAALVSSWQFQQAGCPDSCRKDFAIYDDYNDCMQLAQTLADFAAISVAGNALSDEEQKAVLADVRVSEAAARRCYVSTWSRPRSFMTPNRRPYPRGVHLSSLFPVWSRMVRVHASDVHPHTTTDGGIGLDMPLTRGDTYHLQLRVGYGRGTYVVSTIAMGHAVVLTSSSWANQATDAEVQDDYSAPVVMPPTTTTAAIMTDARRVTGIRRITPVDGREVVATLRAVRTDAVDAANAAEDGPTFPERRRPPLAYVRLVDRQTLRLSNFGEFFLRLTESRSTVYVAAHASSRDDDPVLTGLSLGDAPQLRYRVGDRIIPMRIRAPPTDASAADDDDDTLLSRENDLCVGDTTTMAASLYLLSLWGGVGRAGNAVPESPQPGGMGAFFFLELAGRSDERDGDGFLAPDGVLEVVGADGVVIARTDGATAELRERSEWFTYSTGVDAALHPLNIVPGHRQCFDDVDVEEIEANVKTVRPMVYADIEYTVPLHTSSASTSESQSPSESRLYLTCLRDAVDYDDTGARVAHQTTRLESRAGFFNIVDKVTSPSGDGGDGGDGGVDGGGDGGDGHTDGSADGSADGSDSGDGGDGDAATTLSGASRVGGGIMSSALMLLLVNVLLLL